MLAKISNLILQIANQCEDI